jgi:hypothetical protein
MQKLTDTRLSSTRLKNKPIPEVDDIDSPIPLSIKDLIPKGETTTRLESSGGPKTAEEIKNESFWKSIIKKN